MIKKRLGYVTIAFCSTIFLWYLGWTLFSFIERERHINPLGWKGYRIAMFVSMIIGFVVISKEDDQ